MKRYRNRERYWIGFITNYYKVASWSFFLSMLYAHFFITYGLWRLFLFKVKTKTPQKRSQKVLTLTLIWLSLYCYILSLNFTERLCSGVISLSSLFNANSKHSSDIKQLYTSKELVMFWKTKTLSVIILISPTERLS